MNYEMENNIANPEDEETILPDGWAEGDDIFAEDKWTGETAADEQEEETVEESEEGKAEEEDPAPTTEQETESDVTEATEEESAPTTEQKAEEKPNTVKTKIKFNREEKEIEVDLDKDLATHVQKSLDHDQMKASNEKMRSELAEMSARMSRMDAVARQRGFESMEALMDDYRNKAIQEEVDRKVDGGMDEEMARDWAERKYPKVATPTKAAEPTESGTAQRDFKAEAAVLMQARPDLAGKPLPAEVINAARDGKNLMVAYFEYEVQQAKADAENVRKENNILKQNAAAAAKAPVKGSNGGGATDTKAKDPFLEGFDSDY